MSDPDRKSDADSCSSIEVKTEWNADSCSSVDAVIPYLWGYQDPTADGLFRHCDPNGQLKSEYEQKSGRIVGEWRVWHDNGVLARVTPYVAGKIHGVVRQWDENGKLLDEYTMSEGYRSQWHRVLHERYYEWAIADFEREIAQDFSFLRQVGGSTNLRIIALMKSVSLEERRQLASTLVRRMNKFWIGSEVPMRWTPEDDRILAWYHERIRIPLREEWEGSSESRLERHATYIRDKRELMRAVREELMLVFPGKPRKQSKEELLFHATVHGFDIETVVWSGTSWQLWYFHRLRHPPSGLEVSDITLMSWLGIQTPTLWWEITEASIPATAKTVGDLCRHFIAAADHFLAEPTDGSLGKNRPGADQQEIA